MASKKIVTQLAEQWLSLSAKALTQKHIEDLTGVYYQAFRAYKDHEIQEAADEYSQVGEFYPPKPAQILSLVKSAGSEKHKRELIEHWTCAMCHQKVDSITYEGICLDCSGVPIPTYENIKPLKTPNRVNYRMEGRIVCQQCGQVAMCIKEPSESGQWKCRQCYTGLTGQEISATFRKISQIMEYDNA